MTSTEAANTKKGVLDRDHEERRLRDLNTHMSHRRLENYRKTTRNLLDKSKQLNRGTSTKEQVLLRAERWGEP